MSTVFQQPALELPPLSARNDPASSRIAEQKVRKSGIVRGQALELLAVIKRNPGMSTKQLAKLANADRHVYGRRASTLWQNGLVIRGESKTQELKFWAILESEITE
jgi:predicted transcriptional regulator